MPEHLLGPWLRRFLVEYLVTDRDLASNTQPSYRDTWVLLLPFLAGQVRQTPDRLQVTDLTPERVRQFLKHLEHDRQCSAITCNQRLAAIRSFAGFVAAHSPEHVDWCGQVRAVPVKKDASSPVQYLELDEVQAVLAAPDPATPSGRRERLLLQFLYNTGARASEAA